MTQANLVATAANEIYMHPMGILQIEGFGRLRNYYKDAFDRLGVAANVIRRAASVSWPKADNLIAEMEQHANYTLVYHTENVYIFSRPGSQLDKIE